MSQGASYLHSHSAIERDMKFKKHIVLVDEEYGSLFQKAIPYVYNNKTYLQVRTMEFVEKGGVFKNFDD